MTTIYAESALLPEGWAKHVEVEIDTAGRIVAVNQGASASVEGGAKRRGQGCVLLPAVANLHSHSFQRAMAGLTERRGPAGKDNFWTWRDTMFRFVDLMTPEDVERVAAFAFMEMLESGFASVAEFHYLHHQTGGDPYDNLTELGDRVVQGALTAGIGLTLLPVLYVHGGLDGRSLSGGQLRFGNDTQRYQKLLEQQRSGLSNADMRLGVAPHSLRAVPLELLPSVVDMAPEGPLHIHAAEQRSEVDEMFASTGARSVEWLLNHAELDERWCVIHATHMTPSETDRLADSGAVAGLCPETEANLGDGVFNGTQYFARDGWFGVGTDSNIRIDGPGELRQLEYSQRLRAQERVLIASASRSAGEELYLAATKGGARALARDCGTIEVGRWADLVRLDLGHRGLAHAEGGTALDAWIFAAAGPVVRDVWSAGRHSVVDGRHVRRDAIESDYRACMTGLIGQL